MVEMVQEVQDRDITPIEVDALQSVIENLRDSHTLLAENAFRTFLSWSDEREYVD